MRFPMHITTDAIAHQVRNGLKGNKRYPMVLMLEPLYTCNLACLGCALERHTGKLEDRMSLEDCLSAVEESGAPIVSICGGEPTIYPELKQLLEGIIERKRHIYLCTNALLLDKNLFGKVAPHKRLTINVHLDGMQKTHDLVCDRAGVFDKAIEMIKESKRLGYHVTTNTTVFKETEMSEIEDVCKLVSELGVDGMMISPGYHYESVDRDIFLSQRETQTKFKRVLELIPEVSPDVDADVSGVHCRNARLQLLAVEHRDSNSARLEGPMLSDRSEVLRYLGSVLDWSGLAVLGIARGQTL